MGVRGELPKPPVPLRRRIPAEAADYFTAEEVERSKTYQRPLKRARRAAGLASWIVAIGIVWFDVGPRLDRSVGGPWPLRLIVILAVMVAVLGAVSVPVSAWRILRYDRRWGFSRQTAGGYVQDRLKGFVLIVVVLGALLIPVWALIRATALWWVLAAVVIAAFQLVLRTVAPFLLRAFNKLEPMPDGSLKQRLREVAATAGAPVSEYLVMDASKRTSKDNAMFTGAGRTKQVIVFDNMLEMPEEQVAVVVAHELGHWRRARPIRDALIETLLWPITLGVVALIVTQQRVLDFAGVEDLGEPGALPLFALVLFALGLVTNYASMWWSRRVERYADLDALELTRDPEAFIATWRSLRERNLPDLDPSRLERLRLSHPPIAERIAFGELWARSTAQVD